MLLKLPAPLLKGAMALEETIARRKSVRRFTQRALSLAQLSQMLWSAQGVTHGRSRAVPSAGATYPLEIAAICGDGGVEGLEAGVYRYVAEGHGLELVRQGDIRSDLAGAALGQQSVAEAPATLVVCAVLSRTMGRYGRRGERYVHFEAGHVGQDVHLQAVALGLSAVMIGAFDDEAVGRLLGLEEAARPLYIMPVGVPA